MNKIHQGLISGERRKVFQEPRGGFQVWDILKNKFPIKHNKEDFIPEVLLTKSTCLFLDAFKIQKKKEKEEALTTIPSLRLDESFGAQVSRKPTLPNINV